MLLCSNCHRLVHNNEINFKFQKCYFNDNYYDWDLIDKKQIDHITLESKDKYSDKDLKCPICGQIKNKKSNICLNCFSIERKVFEIDREQLKQLIRNYSFADIAKQFNVSSTSIRKRCKKLNIPHTKEEINKYSDDEWNFI